MKRVVLCKVTSIYGDDFCIDSDDLMLSPYYIVDVGEVLVIANLYPVRRVRVARITPDIVEGFFCVHTEPA